MFVLLIFNVGDELIHVMLFRLNLGDQNQLTWTFGLKPEDYSLPKTINSDGKLKRKAILGKIIKVFPLVAIAARNLHGIAIFEQL